MILLVSLLVLAPAGMAAAKTPVPSLQSTAPYKSLKSYVNLLRERSATPTTVERKQAYRSQLTTKRNAAATKAKSIFKLTVDRIKKKDDAQERRQIKQIRQNQKAQVTALNSSLAAQLESIGANEKVAANRLNDRYANRINPLARERSALERERTRARTAVKRDRLTRRIKALQDEINALSRSQQSALTALETKFNGRADAANSRFATRIESAKAAAKRQIQQARRAWKNLFREEFAEAKEKRSDNFDRISDLRENGVGYIERMPLHTPAE